MIIQQLLSSKCLEAFIISFYFFRKTNRSVKSIKSIGGAKSKICCSYQPQGIIKAKEGKSRGFIDGKVLNLGYNKYFKPQIMSNHIHSKIKLVSFIFLIFGSNDSIRIINHYKYMQGCQFQKVVDNIPLQAVSIKDMKQKILHQCLAAIVTTQNAKRILGTGVLISRNLILTAAHNILGQDGQYNKESFQIYIGAYGVCKEYHEVQDWRYLHQIIKKQNDIMGRPQCDYVLIKIKQNKQLPIVQRYFPLISYPCDCIKNKHPLVRLSIYGYPQYLTNYLEFNDGINLNQFGSSRLNAILQMLNDNFMIKYTVSTMSGQSGSPIMDGDKIIGIHTCNSIRESFNIGRFVSLDFVKNLLFWCKQLNGHHFEINKEYLCSHVERSALDFHDIGMRHYQEGNYKIAEEYYAKSIQIKKNSSNSHQIAPTMHCMGLVYKNQGHYKKALKHYEKSLQIELKIGKGRVSELDLLSYNNYSIESAITLSCIGSVYFQQGQRQKAFTYFKKSLQIQQKRKCKSSIESASTLNNIGNIFYYRKNYVKAREYCNQSLQIKQKFKEKGCFDSASSLHSIGMIYLGQGSYIKALQYLNEALSIKQRFKGIGCIQSASTLYCIGVVYHKKSLKNHQYSAQALKYYYDSLEIEQKIKGKGCLTSAMTLSSIGLIFHNQENTTKAIQYYKMAVEIFKNFSIENEDHANTLLNLSYAYYEQKTFKKAYDYYSRAAEIFNNRNIQMNRERESIQVQLLQYFHEHQLKRQYRNIY